MPLVRQSTGASNPEEGGDLMPGPAAAMDARCWPCKQGDHANCLIQCCAFPGDEPHIVCPCECRKAPAPAPEKCEHSAFIPLCRSCETKALESLREAVAELVPLRREVAALKETILIVQEGAVGWMREAKAAVARAEKAEAALRPLAAVADAFDTTGFGKDEDTGLWSGQRADGTWLRLTVGDAQRARAALAQSKPDAPGGKGGRPSGNDGDPGSGKTARDNPQSRPFPPPRPGARCPQCGGNRFHHGNCPLLPAPPKPEKKEVR